MEMLENFHLVKTLLKNVKNEIDMDVVGIIYNDNQEITISHVKKIITFLKKQKIKRALVVIEGIGGDPKAAKLLALDLKKQFKQGFISAVVNYAASALVYPILASNKLLMGNSSYITPVDPLQRTERGYRTASSLMQESEKAKSFFLREIDQFIDILQSPCSVIHSDEHTHVDSIAKFVKLFFTNSHNKRIKIQDLKKVSFYVDNPERELYWENLSEAVNQVRSDMVKNRRISAAIICNEEHTTL